MVRQAYTICLHTFGLVWTLFRPRHVAITTSCRTSVVPQLVRPFRMAEIKSAVPSCRDTYVTNELYCSVFGFRPQVLEFSSLVFRGQCHIIHLTILRRFSWPSLAYMDKGSLKPHSFIHSFIQLCLEIMRNLENEFHFFQSGESQGI